MQTLHDLAFKSPNPPQDRRVKGRLQDNAYDILIYDINWTEPGEGVFNPKDHCFIELLYHPIEHIQGRYSNRVHHGSPKNIGKVLFIPPGNSLHTRWTTGHQKTLSCLFNLSQLGLVGGFEWSWNNIALESTLDINNAYLETLLHRLAEETATPGFASKMEADCLLTLIALEIRRQFPELGLNDQLSDGKLSHQQINILRDKIEASTGAGPSLTELADACNIPPRQLSTSFKITTGNTLRNFISESRINKAQTLLLNRKLLIKEVAYLSGFQNAAAFTAAFRKSVGMTPQQFRDSRQ